MDLEDIQAGSFPKFQKKTDLYGLNRHMDDLAYKGMVTKTGYEVKDKTL